MEMETLLAFLRQLKPIADDDAAVITSYFKFRQAKEGECLLEPGQVCRTLFFITTGVMRIFGVNDRGQDITHYFISDKQFCTILKSFNGETIADDGIQACCDVDLLYIGKRDLLELYQKLPYMVDLINEVNQERMLEKIRLKNIYSGEDAANRYKLFLTEQADVANRVPQHHIASYLNITPQSLSRIRRGLS